MDAAARISAQQCAASSGSARQCAFHLAGMRNSLDP